MGGRPAYRSQRMETQLQLLSEDNLRHLRSLLRHADRLSYAEWRDIAMVWFRETAARETVIEILNAAEAGRICPENWKGGALNEDEIRTTKFLLWDEVKEPCVGPGMPPSKVPGLVLRLKREVQLQVGKLQDLLLETGRDLDVQGNRKGIRDPQVMPFRRIAVDAFLDGVKPGSMIVVAGRRGSGKTHFGLQHLAAPALEKGWIVVSNIEIENPPTGYIYATTFSEALIAGINGAMAGKWVLFLRDEGAQGRARADAQTWEAKSQRSASATARHMGLIEGVIYQREAEVASEVEDACTHLYRKTTQENQGYVFCETETGTRGAKERWEVGDLPSLAELKKAGRPHLDYETLKFAPLEVDADFTPLVQVVYKNLRARNKGKISQTQILEAMKQMLEMIHEPPSLKNPMSMEQLHRVVAAMHFDDPQLSPHYFAKILAEDWKANGFTTEDDAKAMMRGWQMSGHPKTRVRRCGMCINLAQGHDEDEGEDDHSTSNTEPRSAGKPMTA